jgi:hypothetical protein
MQVKMEQNLKSLLDVLMLFQDKNFVQRLLNPYVFPRINNQDGSFSTHLMSSMDNIAFPHITQNPNTGELEQAIIRTPSSNYDWGQALKTAKDRGDFIQFNTPEEADYFATNYKKALGWE